MNKEVSIPENIQQICREFADVARKHELRNFSVKFSPGWEMEWGGDVQAYWEHGRHGDDSNRLAITSEFRVNTSVTVPKI